MIPFWRLALNSYERNTCMHINTDKYKHTHTHNQIEAAPSSYWSFVVPCLRLTNSQRLLRMRQHLIRLTKVLSSNWIVWFWLVAGRAITLRYIKQSNQATLAQTHPQGLSLISYPQSPDRQGISESNKETAHKHRHRNTRAHKDIQYPEIQNLIPNRITSVEHVRFTLFSVEFSPIDGFC